MKIIFVLILCYASTSWAKCTADHVGPCNDVFIDEVLPSSAIIEDNYIKEARDSSIDMLRVATQKYKTGKITKEQFLQIAIQVGTMADYAAKSINGGLTVEAPMKSVNIPTTP